MTPDSRTYQSTGRALLTCKNPDCKNTGSREFTTTTTTYAYQGRPESHTTVTVDGRERTIRFKGDTDRALYAPCPQCKGTAVRVTVVRGTLNEGKPCDGRCLNARRASCECSCAGANHGASHGGW